MADSAVILWWGRDLRLLGAGSRVTDRVLAEGEDPVAAILELLAAAGPSAVSVRLAYHPAALDAQPVACPAGSRERLRRTLGGEFPELNEPDTVWSLEPPRPDAGGSATVLYVERRSHLPRLVAELARRGVRTEGAWPLSSLVEAAVPRAGAGRLGLVALRERSLVCCLDAAGGRQVRMGEGADSAAVALAELAAAGARFEEEKPPPGLAVIEDGPQAPALRSAAEARALSEISLGEFLGRARSLRPGAPADFLAPLPLFSRRPDRRKIARAAGVALAACLLGAGGMAWRRERRERRRDETQRAEAARLDRDLQTRRAAAETLDRLREELGRLACAPQRQGELLAALAASVPRELTLEEVTMRGARFAIRGRVDDGAGDPVRRFCQGFGGADAPWRLADPPPAANSVTAADAEFVLQGSWPTGEPAAVGATGGAAPMAAQLAAARARLLSAAGFGGWLRRWSSNWIVEPGPNEALPDLEIRHCRLAYRSPTLRAWPDIVQTVQAACAEPGVTVDSLDLAAAPDGVDAFQRANFSLTARLRP